MCINSKAKLLSISLLKNNFIKMRWMIIHVEIFLLHFVWTLLNFDNCRTKQLTFFFSFRGIQWRFSRFHNTNFAGVSLFEFVTERVFREFSLQKEMHTRPHTCFRTFLLFFLPGNLIQGAQNSFE